jgi:glycerol-3-phosphate dehydrogenase (NAD(P)+)
MTLTVVGAGAFGTALAVALSRNGTPVTLVARDEDRAKSLNADRVNARHLPGVMFPETLCVSAGIETESADTVLLAVPMQALSDVVADMCGPLAKCSMVACCKGIDLQSGRGPSAVL